MNMRREIVNKEIGNRKPTLCSVRKEAPSGGGCRKEMFISSGALVFLLFSRQDRIAGRRGDQQLCSQRGGSKREACC